MGRYDLTEKAKGVALSHGADLAGVVQVVDLSEHADSISRILPTAQCVMVIAAKHSLASIRSANIQMAQFDTIHAYEECTRAAHKTSRYLESEGFSSVAVPAFIPIDMRDPKKGMKGEICWRRAGVRAGLGSYGENGLLVTKEFGAAIRISGLVTSAELEADQALDEDSCDHCMRCIEACPVGALSGEGKINKKICGNQIFKYGFRYFAEFMKGLNQKPAAEIEEVFKGYGIREMWQTFMTGNYYYCFQCQSQCPATELPSKTMSS
ncbi:MAG: epoxyqueuosine reductase [Desulfobacteraceae bacterium]|nr:epoxyqueuosine reductase [Desulfobacteraceae bacterium]